MRGTCMLDSSRLLTTQSVFSFLPKTHRNTAIIITIAMDPLSFTAGVLGLLTRAKEITRRLQVSGDSSGREDRWILEELSVYENVFSETAEIMLKSLPSIPSSAMGCLGMCNESMRELEALTQFKGKGHKVPKIEKHAQPFLRSVMLFRNIVMEYVRCLFSLHSTDQHQ